MNPNYATAHHWYSGLLAVVGKQDEALAEAKQAIELDPLSLPINSEVGNLYRDMGRYDEAIQQYRKALEIDPKYVSAHFSLGQAYFLQQKYAEGFSEFKKGAVDSADPRGINDVTAVWNVFQKSGYKAAMKTMTELEIQASSYRYVSPAEIASGYFAAGEKDRGFSWLEKAYNERDDSLEEIKTDPALAPFRSDPRYADLLRRMELPQ